MSLQPSATTDSQEFKSFRTDSPRDPRVLTASPEADMEPLERSVDKSSTETLDQNGSPARVESLPSSKTNSPTGNPPNQFPTRAGGPPGGPLTVDVRSTSMRMGHNGSLARSTSGPLGNTFSGSFPNVGTLSNGPLYERLSHSDISELREAFILLAGGEKEQEITPQSLAKMLNSIGQHPKDESELKTLISAADQIRNGTISFPEFVVLMAYKVEEPQVHEMVSAFKHFDRANTGYVTRAQFCELFAGYGEKMAGEEMEEMLNQADPQGTDKIDYLKWVQSMSADTGLQTCYAPPHSGGITPITGSFAQTPSGF